MVTSVLDPWHFRTDPDTRGSAPIPYGSGSGSCSCRQWLSKMPAKNSFFSNLFAYYFLKLHLHQSLKIKSLKEATEEQKSRFYQLFLLEDEKTCTHNDGSGSERPKSLRIRIRTTTPVVRIRKFLGLSDPDPSLFVQVLSSSSQKGRLNLDFCSSVASMFPNVADPIFGS